MLRPWISVPLFMLLAAPTFAQDTVTASRVELAIPFGVATGKLVTLVDDVVFVNDERPDDSFALRKTNIADAEIGDGVVTLRTREPVGGMQRFIFRLENPAKVAALVAWAKEAPAPAITEAQKENAPPTAEPIGDYQVRHEHRFRGGCRGKLVVTSGRVSFESVEEIGHSRQWDISDIKELRRPNPYKLEMRPFVGADYEFELIGGEGMTSREYKALADVIANHRVPR